MHDITTLLQYALEHNLAFAAWRYPGKTVQGVFAEQALSVAEGDIPVQSGFLVAPFSRKRHPAYLIPDHVTYPFAHTMKALKTLSGQTPAEVSFPHITTREEYFHAFGKVQDAIRQGEAEKVVLSRTKETSLVNRKNAARFFMMLESAYPRAMVYICHIPEQRCWIGATPEILLSGGEHGFETVAVASTKRAESPTAWSGKEVHEQAVVSGFIEQVLHSHQIDDYERKGPEDYHAGNVKHLKTSYRIPAGSITTKVFRVADSLHPTPAVCGAPRDVALQLIRKEERHNRRFYAGYLGKINPAKQEAELYVNLRCMQVFTDRSVLYSGGGITRGSQAPGEWDETEEKCRTLLNVADNL